MLYRVRIRVYGLDFLDSRFTENQIPRHFIPRDDSKVKSVTRDEVPGGLFRHCAVAPKQAKKRTISGESPSGKDLPKGQKIKYVNGEQGQKQTPSATIVVSPFRCSRRRPGFSSSIRTVLMPPGF